MRTRSKPLRWLYPIIALGLIALFIPDAVARAEAGDTCFGRKPTILGTSGDDRLKGTSRSDVIAGMAGNDVVSGLGGNDYLCGFSGDDRVLGGSGGDTISGDQDDDALVGGGGRDYLLGWGGDDSIDGGPGKDIASWWGSTTGVTASLSTATAMGQGSDSLKSIEGLEGGRGDDSLVGDDTSNWFALGPGDDTVDGAGNYRDFVSYYYSKEGVSVNLAAGTATGEGTDTITAVEGVYGSKYDDTITGDEQANWITPGPGDDVVDGAGAFDVDDIVDYTASKAAISVDLAVGTASGEGTDTLTGIEGVRGSKGNDTITGEDSGDELAGGGGDDTLVGGEGNDNLIGEDGDDSLDGGAGDDLLSGGYGSDLCLNGEENIGCET